MVQTWMLFSVSPKPSLLSQQKKRGAQVKPAQLTRRIQELSDKLKPMPSDVIKIDFHSFTEPEQSAAAQES
jgi:hypothetical protein